jgi:hypothetical protein
MAICCTCTETDRQTDPRLVSLFSAGSRAARWTCCVEGERVTVAVVQCSSWLVQQQYELTAVLRTECASVCVCLGAVCLRVSVCD